MMIVQIDKMSAPSREHAQRLYERNVELEANRRRSAQARVPSDPSAWQQMRENYEAIILEDRAFSEQHNIEYALWQLHYKRIEELRAHHSAALASSGSNTSQGVQVPPRPDRLTKIRLQFKTFLSEATGFYHDLILKIRAKYGLPFGYFSDDSESQIIMGKDGKKSADIKKGLVSCHRCLIYLGDLARYKGLYGDGDSKSREYAAASSYYLQAASIWPSSGNPHHQLAILASYSGDELVAIYWYFRSLAVDNPFSTARDNLIVAFEKRLQNRHNYSQLHGDVKTPFKEPAVRLSGKGRGKLEAKLASKDANMEPNPSKEKVSGFRDIFKSFCIRFVRLNGILFTRTSLETFADVLTRVSRDLCELLSSGPEEELNFGTGAAENALLLVRLVAILIFTVHNLKRESEGQTYAEIVQRAALLQNAFAAVFELIGLVVERCSQLRDVSSSYTLPSILVFLEWLACCPDIAAAGSDVDEKQSITRSLFWKHCVSLLNKILSIRPRCMDDDEEEACFFNMSRYEGETENRLALWEDFELRGFLPLAPAHSILDFSRKCSFVSDGNKERKARVKRILAAGKALANVIRVDQKTVCFDSKAKKFLIGVEPFADVTVSAATPVVTNSEVHETPSENITNIGNVQPIPQPRTVGEEDDDDDEVIVFQPAMSEKRTEVMDHNHPPSDILKLDQSSSAGDLKFYGSTMPAPYDSLHQHDTFDASHPLPASVGNFLPQHLQPVQMHGSRWSVEEATSLANSLKSLKILENGHLTKSQMEDNLGFSHPAAHSVAIQQPINVHASGMYCSRTKISETVMPSRINAIVSSEVTGDDLAARTTSSSLVGMQKNPISRPVRHLGPPPGFSPVPLKALNESVSAVELRNPLMDDYSWLDGHQLASSLEGSTRESSLYYVSHADPQHVNNRSNGFTGTVSFPFPGKQAPAVQFHMEKDKGWQDYNTFEHHHEQKLHQQQLVNGNQQFSLLPGQYPGQSAWTGPYFV
ncbi:nonsense-mediated mRNA decay factor SMG7-like isoform X1 [Gossypium arboreum]|uniref:nonsense-mediated mRNA decay factor SMG7-like isoform X1 n=2 Tax=Gossypium arboreum TaxID=29729 RepID=UPI00081979C4|nr:nonsense-mediated mRNA decay factor SMG7-like isoform X1 [Gossypium arboreum]XP_017606749.1 nonsense-mediated mRNA decay factor SMG7-like isoform X1 [Gossypium arboreum]XP_052883996.1 nonsense-mediated mRNA decay factor SMG7-like isoform X1 [Gossypium arboreum]XP_052883997.1 nonsense-mediated mRNA decay factor SMG7-like isoform X1 [Gossypium arboreum]